MSGPDFEYDGDSFVFGGEYDDADIPAKFASWFVPAIPPEYANLSAFPIPGVSGTDYIAMDSRKTYVWTGSGYLLRIRFYE
jgi:hypothetical protein